MAQRCSRPHFTARGLPQIELVIALGIRCRQFDGDRLAGALVNGQIGAPASTAPQELLHSIETKLRTSRQSATDAANDLSRLKCVGGMPQAKRLRAFWYPVLHVI